METNQVNRSLVHQLGHFPPSLDCDNPTEHTFGFKTFIEIVENDLLLVGCSVDEVILRVSRLADVDKSVVSDFFFDRGPLTDDLARYIAKVQECPVGKIWKSWYEYKRDVESVRVGLSDFYKFSRESMQNSLKELELMADEMVREREAEIPLIEKVCKALNLVSLVAFTVPSCSSDAVKKQWQKKTDEFYNLAEFLEWTLEYNPSFSANEKELLLKYRKKVMDCNGKMGVSYMIVQLFDNMMRQLSDLLSDCKNKENIPGLEYFDTELDQILELPQTFRNA